jgi:hypothetical protein
MHVMMLSYSLTDCWVGRLGYLKVGQGAWLGFAVSIQLGHLVSDSFLVAFFTPLRVNGWAWWHVCQTLCRWSDCRGGRALPKVVGG